MDILRTAEAGTVAKGDVLVKVAPGSGKREIKLESMVKALY